MSALNSFFNSLFAVVWSPFQGINPWVGLTVLSVLVGIAALLGMKYFSNQDRIEELKERYKAHVLAIRLFRDDLGIVMGSMFRTLNYIARYMGHSLRPMVVLLVPIVFLFAQMQMRLAYEPWDVGHSEVILVDLEAEVSAEQLAATSVDLPDGVEVCGPVGVAVAKNRVAFPIKATVAGKHLLKFRCGDETVEKSLHVATTDDLDSLSPVRSSGFWDLLLFPTEATFGDSSAFTKIKVPYGIKPLMLFGFDCSFGIELGMGLVFMVISIVIAFALKGVFGVTI